MVSVAIYKRIDGKAHFKTAMTTVHPSAKGSQVLHPSVGSVVLSFRLPRVLLTHTLAAPAKAHCECARMCARTGVPGPLRVHVGKQTAGADRRGCAWRLVISKSCFADMSTSQQLRQIGNAVPVPLALALGKALGDSLLTMWAEEEREGSPEV